MTQKYKKIRSNREIEKGIKKKPKSCDRGTHTQKYKNRKKDKETHTKKKHIKEIEKQKAKSRKQKNVVFSMGNVF